jgi:hypothetical protein
MLSLPGTSIEQKDEVSLLNITPSSYMSLGLELKG